MSPVQVFYSNFEREKQILCLHGASLINIERVCVFAHVHCDFSIGGFRYIFLLHSHDKGFHFSCLVIISLLIILLLVKYFKGSYHVTVCRQRPKSDCFVILAAHVISTQHQRATLSLTPPQSSADRHRESLLPAKQRSVYRVVTFSTHRTSPEKEKRAANKHPLFSLKQDAVCCCALGSDVIGMVHPPCDLWADDSQIASSGGTCTNYGTDFVSLSHPCTNTNMHVFI